MSYEQEYAKLIAKMKETDVSVPKARIWYRLMERKQQRRIIFYRPILVFTLLLILFSGLFATQTYQANRFIEELTRVELNIGTFESEYVSDLLAE